MSVPRVAVVGCHGYGARHVMAVLALQARGRVEVVGLVDPVAGPVTREGVTVGTDQLPPFWPSLPALLAARPVDVVVVATPLHLHVEQAAAALAVGADVLLEKPPVTGRDELDALLEAERCSPGRVQVGLQALGSAALTRLTAAVRDGALGEVRGIGAWGSWSRPRAYYERAAWAGRRRLAGRVVLDGAVSNPFAHAVADALHLAGRTSRAATGQVDLELFRAHAIEADDTSAVRVPAGAGAGPDAADVPVVAAFTLAGPHEEEPVVEVRGSRGTARLLYAQDRLEVDGPAAARRLIGTHPRRDLLEDLLEARRTGGPLLSPLAATAGLVEVVEAVRRVEPLPVRPEHVTWHGEGAAARPVLAGVEQHVRDVVRTGELFRGIGAPWVP